jgi:gluconolactonase
MRIRIEPAHLRGAALLLFALVGAGAAAGSAHYGKDTARHMETEPGLIKVAGDLKFPEGPAYDGKGSIFVSNCDSDYITQVTLDDKVSISHKANPEGQKPFTFQKTNGMTFYKDGSLFVCDFGRNAVLRIFPNGEQEIFVDSWQGKPLEGPNDLAFDPEGNLYFTAPAGSSKEKPTGPLYRVEKGSKKITKVADGMGFPNGLAFTADAKTLYVCESSFNRILKFRVNPDGSLSDKQVAADLSPNGDGAPDGMALDAKGNLWVTHFGQHSVLVFDPSGKIVRRIGLPFHRADQGPTNIEFAGKDLKTVYISDPGDNALWKLRVDTPGLKLFCSPRNTAKR